MDNTIIIDQNGKGHRKRHIPHVVNWILYVVILAVIFWFMLPPINLRSKDFWVFVTIALAIRFVMSAFSAITTALRNASARRNDQKGVFKKSDFSDFGKFSKAVGIIVIALVVMMIIGSVIGCELFNASRYNKLLTYDNGDFGTDVAELSMNSIPVVDKDTAQRLSLRKLGEMDDLVSQFEISEEFNTQINYKNEPYRVTPLVYGDVFKWLNNQSDGIPAYIGVNMVTQETKLVRLKSGMKYSTSEYFMRYINRYLRFKYPTKILDDLSFEIDDEGTPYWIASTITYRIGLWDGRDVNGAVLVNAVTGESKYYDVKDIPSWVDQVYSSSMIIDQLTYNGKYKSGFFNSIFGQRGVLQPTDGYNYLAINDDVYLYTGITSVASDQSNVGFVLVNLRTKETSYYTCPGAEEYSAMESAEGVVQDLGYSSTFPLLLNVSDRPTYFVSLKDSAGLVKMYAFIDVQQYQVVATGSTIDEARESYAKKLKKEANVDISGGGVDDKSSDKLTVTGTVSKISEAVVSSNTRYYIMLDGDDKVYMADVKISNMLPFVQPGDTVTLTYKGDGKSVTVSKFENGVAAQNAESGGDNSSTAD